MQDNYVNRQDNYVYMQNNYVYMQVMDFLGELDVYMIKSLT